MNVTECRLAGAVLSAVFVDHDPAAGLPAAQDLAARIGKILRDTGISYPRAAQLTAPAAAGEDGPRCFHCGCTEEQACPGGCSWVPGPVDGDLCSRCAAELAVLAAALDHALGYLGLRFSSCEACRAGDCAGHQADRDLAVQFRELLAGSYSAYLQDPSGAAAC